MNFDQFISTLSPGDFSLRDDSRKVQKGDIFIALPGENCEEHIKDALNKGAKFIICNKEYIPNEDESGIYINHPDIRSALAKLASVKWQTEKHDIKYIGITGTNGKTTSANMLDSLFTALNHKCGLLGTIKYKWPGFSQPAPLTTPGALSLHEMLQRMDNSGVNTCIMEVSSHALSQKRVAEIPFSAALFTNLTQDHLDYHKDMESYFRAKATLFLDLPKKGKAIAINQDNPYGRRLLELLPDAIAYGLYKNISQNRQLLGQIISSDRNGLYIRMTYEGKAWELNSPLIGEYNAMNLLGVQALCLAMGIDADDLKVLENFHGVCGRLERIRNPQNRHIFVDYAHTPDALINVLKSLRKANFKKIITVFGCGGNRDRSKRPLMGQAVAEYSDIAILTSDNPRNEDPVSIMNDVLPGLSSAKKFFMEADRYRATEMALEILQADEALLIAGKGHEDYQIIGEEKRHYSDQEVVREILGCE